MEVQSNGQKMAKTAYERIRQRHPSQGFATFACSFPSLVESCGLAQAIALAKAKGHYQYLEDLAVVLNALGHAEAASAEGLERATLEHSVPAYAHLSCGALQAAGYLKRCVEAVGD
jgi:CRISPR-associated protein Cmr5